jgi:hypothetical protein
MDLAVELVVFVDQLSEVVVRFLEVVNPIGVLGEILGSLVRRMTYSCLPLPGRPRSVSGVPGSGRRGVLTVLDCAVQQV